MSIIDTKTQEILDIIEDEISNVNNSVFTLANIEKIISIAFNRTLEVDLNVGLYSSVRDNIIKKDLFFNFLDFNDLESNNGKNKVLFYFFSHLSPKLQTLKSDNLERKIEPYNRFLKYIKNSSGQAESDKIINIINIFQNIQDEIDENRQLNLDLSKISICHKISKTLFDLEMEIQAPYLSLEGKKIVDALIEPLGKRYVDPYKYNHIYTHSFSKQYNLLVLKSICEHPYRLKDRLFKSIHPSTPKKQKEHIYNCLASMTENFLERLPLINKQCININEYYIKHAAINFYKDTSTSFILLVPFNEKYIHCFDIATSTNLNTLQTHRDDRQIKEQTKFFKHIIKLKYGTLVKDQLKSSSNTWMRYLFDKIKDNLSDRDKASLLREYIASLDDIKYDRFIHDLCSMIKEEDRTSILLSYLKKNKHLEAEIIAQTLDSKTIAKTYANYVSGQLTKMPLISTAWEREIIQDKINDHLDENAILPNKKKKKM